MFSILFGECCDAGRAVFLHLLDCLAGYFAIWLQEAGVAGRVRQDWSDGEKLIGGALGVAVKWQGVAVNPAFN